MEEITSVSDFDDKVLANPIPVLVDFFATWCGPCKTLAPILSELAQQHQGTLAVYQVDIERFPEIAARYEVMAVPTLVLFKDSQDFAQQVGVLHQEALARWLEENL